MSTTRKNSKRRRCDRNSESGPGSALFKSGLLFHQYVLLLALEVNAEYHRPRAVGAAAGRVYRPGRNDIAIHGLEYAISYSFFIHWVARGELRRDG